DPVRADDPGLQQAAGLTVAHGDAIAQATILLGGACHFDEQPTLAGLDDDAAAPAHGVGGLHLAGGDGAAGWDDSPGDMADQLFGALPVAAMHSTDIVLDHLQG